MKFAHKGILRPPNRPTVFDTFFNFHVFQIYDLSKIYERKKIYECKNRSENIVQSQVSCFQWKVELALTEHQRFSEMIIPKIRKKLDTTSQ